MKKFIVLLAVLNSQATPILNFDSKDSQVNCTDADSDTGSYCPLSEKTVGIIYGTESTGLGVGALLGLASLCFNNGSRARARLQKSSYTLSGASGCSMLVTLMATSYKVTAALASIGSVVGALAGAAGGLWSYNRRHPAAPPPPPAAPPPPPPPPLHHAPIPPAHPAHPGVPIAWGPRR